MFIYLTKPVCERLSSEDVEAAKKILWVNCERDSVSAGLLFHSCCDFDKKSRLAANLDNFLQAFESLDSSDLIPSVVCEALALLTIPSLSPGPVSHKIHSNTARLLTKSSLGS